MKSDWVAPVSVGVVSIVVGAIVAIRDFALWRTAVDDVSAALIGYRLLLEINGGLPLERDEMQRIELATRDYVPSAREAFTEHQEHAAPCHCRHEALILVGASREAALRGMCYQELARNSLAVLERYLARVS